MTNSFIHVTTPHIHTHSEEMIAIELVQKGDKVKVRKFSIKVTINSFKNCEMHTRTSCLQKQLQLTYTQ